MIDTIVLTIPKGQYVIFEPDKFQPSARFTNDHTMYSTKLFSKYTQNPSKQDYLNGIYKPRLTITPRGYDLSLRIEFSVPKLIFGNNVDEVEESDYEKITEVLKIRLAEMGVRIFSQNLDNAMVSNIHFSKNFELSEYTSATLMLKELGKINLNGKLDLNRTHFSNDGHAVYYYASNHHIVFYDKMADIKKSAKRAVDKEKTVQQLSLFETFKEEKRNEILRLEIRITHRQKLKSILKDKNPTFKAIFKQSLAQKVLLSYWNTIIEKNIYIFKLSTNEPKDILQEALRKPNIKVKDAMSIMAMKYFIDKHGVKTLKDMIKRRFTPESWYRFEKQIDKMVSETFSSNFIVNELNQIKQQLIEFKAFKFDNLNKNV